MTMGAIPYIIVGMGVIALVMMAMNYFVDENTRQNALFAVDPTLPFSQDRNNAMGFLVMLYKFTGGVIVLAVAGILWYKNSTQRSSGEI